MSKNISNALKAFLKNTDNASIADLYTLTFVDGLILRLTSFSSDVIWNGQPYRSLGPRLKRGNIKWEQGLQVDELDLQMAATLSDLANYGLGYQSAMVNGLWDGATATLDRVYFSNPPRVPSELQPDGRYNADTAGRGAVNLFTGRVAEIDAGPLTIAVKLHSLLELLNIQMPRRIFEPNCGWTLYDTGCALPPSNFQVSGTIQAGSTTTRLFVSDMTVPLSAPGGGAALPPGWLAPGKVTLTSGRLSGASRTVAFFQPSGTGTYERLITRDAPAFYYPLGTNANNTIGAAHNGVVTGGVTFNQSSIVSSATSGSTLFDGFSGLITIPLPSPTSFPGGVTGGWTMEFWVQPNQAAFTGVFDGTVVRNFDYGALQGGIEIVPKNPLFSPLLGLSSAPNHVVLQVIGALEINVFLNNNLVGNAPGSKGSNLIVWPNMKLGRAGTTSAANQLGTFEWYNGLLQAFAVYAYTLSPTQIADHYIAGTSVAASVPVAWVDLMSPLPFAPMAGDTFDAFAGCDLTRNNCLFKFNNLDNFGGQPNLPSPDKVLSFG